MTLPEAQAEIVRRFEDGCECQQCGNFYRVDIMVPDDLWVRITGRNLLCPVCIARGIENLREYGAYELRRIT